MGFSQRAAVYQPVSVLSLLFYFFILTENEGTSEAGGSRAGDQGVVLYHLICSFFIHMELFLVLFFCFCLFVVLFVALQSSLSFVCIDGDIFCIWSK